MFKRNPEYKRVIFSNKSPKLFNQTITENDLNTNNFALNNESVRQTYAM